MIFISVGSRSFQFDRLLKAVDKAVEEGKITEKIFAQVGDSTYQVKNFQTVKFLNHDQFNKKIDECDLVITHGGTGIIVNSVKKGKRVVAVPRLAAYKEMVDDHQLQIVISFEQAGLVFGCYDCKNLVDVIQKAREREVVVYKSNTTELLQSIDSFISNESKR